MKTAISIDDNIFEQAERFSQSAGLSRSRLYTTAISEYIQKHSPSIITERLNQYYETHDSKLDDGLKMAAYNLFSKEDW